jgi:hypothetical protein
MEESQGKMLNTSEHCLHFGADCRGPMQTEHITYSPDTKAPICAFHNQVLRFMRLSLVLSKKAASLKGKLTVRQRMRTIEVLKRYRFDLAVVATTASYCSSFAAERGINLGAFDLRET